MNNEEESCDVSFQNLVVAVSAALILYDDCCWQRDIFLVYLVQYTCGTHVISVTLYVFSLYFWYDISGLYRNFSLSRTLEVLHAAIMNTW